MAVLRSLLLLFIMYSVVNADDEKCPNGWTNFGVKCYKYFPQSVNWITAEVPVANLQQSTLPYNSSYKRTCQTYDANLASVHNKLENDLLLNLVPSSTRFWVGAQDGEQEGQWIWSDGSSFDYTSWCYAEPNNTGNKENCLELAYSSARCWNDLPCTEKVAFVCAKNL